jgi:hypothetical protein
MSSLCWDHACPSPRDLLLRNKSLMLPTIAGTPKQRHLSCPYPFALFDRNSEWVAQTRVFW